MDPTDKDFLAKKSEQKYYMSFFPNRVANYEKSAIFETSHSPYKKNYRLMRKKRFDDTKIEKMLYSVFGSKENCPYSETSRTENVQSARAERNKIFTYNVKKTNDKFKNSSVELDKIRHTITQRSKRKNQVASRDDEKTVGPFERQYSDFLRKKESGIESVERVETPTMDTDYEENLFKNLIRKENKKERRLKKQTEYCESGRKVTTGNFLSSIPSSSSKAIHHNECLSRVLQYKNEYRKFLKTDLFGKGCD